MVTTISILIFELLLLTEVSLIILILAEEHKDLMVDQIFLRANPDPRAAVGHPNIYFVTLVHDTISFEVMLKRQQSTNQIIMGLDDPYPLGEMESELQSSYPGKLLDLVLEQGLITQKQHQEIWKDNVAR